jgi:hypothetical protein
LQTKVLDDLAEAPRIRFLTFRLCRRVLAGESCIDIQVKIQMQKTFPGAARQIPRGLPRGLDGWQSLFAFFNAVKHTL